METGNETIIDIMLAGRSQQIFFEGLSVQDCSSTKLRAHTKTLGLIITVSANVNATQFKVKSRKGRQVTTLKN